MDFRAQQLASGVNYVPVIEGLPGTFSWQPNTLLQEILPETNYD